MAVLVFCFVVCREFAANFELNVYDRMTATVKVVRCELWYGVP